MLSVFLYLIKQELISGNLIVSATMVDQTKPKLEIKCIYHQKVHVPALTITDAVGKSENEEECFLF